MRYLISKNFDVNWIVVVSSFQFEFNNALNTFIDQISNKLKFDFFFRDLITLLINNVNQSIKLNLLRIIYRKKTIDIMSFVNVQMKFRYDNKHKFVMFKIDNIIYLRLHKNYFLFSKFDKKLFNQYVESFLVKQRINRLIYELNLFFTLRVHLIISITQLKSIDISINSYSRSKSNYSKFVNIDQQNDNEENSRYEIEKIVDKRFRIFEKIKIWQYLMRWKNWESKNDHWKSKFVCDDCKNLIKKYELRHFKFKTRKFFKKFFTKFLANISNVSTTTSTIIVVTFTTNAFLQLSIRRRDRFKKLRESSNW